MQRWGGWCWAVSLPSLDVTLVICMESLTMDGWVVTALVTIPAAVYLLVEMGLLGGSTSVSGLSALILTLITIDAVRTSAHQPTFM